MDSAKGAEKTINTVGFTGLSAISAVFISQIITLIKGKDNDNMIRRESARIVLVTEVADSWVFMSIGLTTTLTLVSVAYAVNPWGGWQQYADLMVPVVGLGFVLSFLMKPLRDDKTYMRILYGHFTQFAIVCEMLGFVGKMRNRETGSALSTFVRIPLYFGVLKLGLGLRKVISTLPKVEVSSVEGALLVHVFALTLQLSCLASFIAAISISDKIAGRRSCRLDFHRLLRF